MNQVFTPEVTIALAQVAIGGFFFLAVVVGKFVINYAQANVDNKKLQTASNLANAFVHAVEQTEPVAGYLKKEKVANLLSAALQSRKIDISPAEAESLIEAAVNGMNAGKNVDVPVLTGPSEDEIAKIVQDTLAKAGAG